MRKLINWLLFLTLIAACIRCGQAHAGDFTTEFKIEETIFQAANLVDASQTLYIAHHPERFQEAGVPRFIGVHPSDGRVLAYMGASAVGHAAITYALVRLDAPTWAVRTWEAITIADKATAIVHNYSIGVHLAF